MSKNKIKKEIEKTKNDFNYYRKKYVKVIGVDESSKLKRKNFFSNIIHLFKK